MLLGGLLTGIAFGFIIQRVGASQYDNILKALLWRDLSIIKFMAVALTTTLLLTQTLGLWLPMHYAVKLLYVWGVLLGGLIFGVGFALAGYCPGTAVVAMAERKMDAVAAFFGGMAGAFAFISGFPWLAAHFITPQNLGKLTWPAVFNAAPLTVAWIMGLAFIILIYMLPTVPASSEEAETRQQKSL